MILRVPWGHYSVSPILAFLSVFVVSLLLAALLTPWAQRLGQRHGLAREPGGRRKHRGMVSRSGGIPLYIAFAVAVLLTIPIIRTDPKEWTRLGGILLGATFVVLGGLYDDKTELPPLPQILGFLAAALMTVPFFVRIDAINNPFTDRPISFPWYLSLPLTVLWISGTTVTVNWLDGLDGLATGVIAIGCATLFAHMIRLQQYTTALLPLALLGATLGFLPHNFFPARVFLGTSGAYFLGYALGVLSIMAGAKMATMLLVVGVPILDVVWQVFRRLRRRQPVGVGDRGHLHFRLFDLGLLSQRTVVLVYYAVSVVMGVLALTIPDRIHKLYALLGLCLVTLSVLTVLGRRECGEEKETDAAGGRDQHAQSS